MELFSFEYLGKRFSLLVSSSTGAEQLAIDGQPVASVRSATTSNAYQSSHEFELADRGSMRLDFKVDNHRRAVDYALYSDEQLLLRESAPVVANLSNGVAGDRPAETNKRSGSLFSGGHSVSLLGLFFKLLKSAKAVKVLLAGAALASWTILFSWQFALVLIAVLVFHEYGHLRAMQKCGLKTKGIYLIPFFGGMALGEKATSHWHEVYISMMGPVFGLFMAIAFYAVFLITGNHFAGLVASVSGLLNLFNLLPVYPLDGGHVVKSLVLSGQRFWGFTLLLILSAACFALALSFGLTFLSFFIAIGAVDLIASRGQFAAHQQTPLDRNGIWYCTLWYFGVVGVFIAIIVSMAKSGVPGTELATAILQS